jgi:hypothetical protein
VDLPTNTRELCGSSDSFSGEEMVVRVLIYGILQHPAGEEIAQSLYQNCNIHSISGIADHTLSGDIPLRLESLLKTIPTFRLHRLQHLQTQDAFQRIIQDARPTHIIYLETSSFASDSFPEQFHPMYKIRSSLVAVEQLLRAMVIHSHQEVSSSTTSSSLRPIMMTYVSTDNHSQDASSTIQATLSAKIFSIFQSVYNVNIQHLILPEVFGPFHETSTWLNDNLFRSTNSTTSLMIPYTSNKMIVHVQRAVSSIVSTTLKPTTSIMNKPWILPTDKTIALSKLTKALKQLRSDQNLSRYDKSYDALVFLLAWYFTTQNPLPKRTTKEAEALGKSYADAMELTKKHLLGNETNGISLQQRLDNQLFPCDSECSGPLMACKSRSIWSSVANVSRNVTSTCRYVLYLANFSKKLALLEQLRENQEEGKETLWPRETLCRIAFVSSNSDIVKSALKDEMNTSNGNNRRSIKEMNGNIQYNGWTLVWTEETKQSLTEADLMLPKIVPRTLFGENITRALYIEPQHFKSLPSLPVVWFLLSKQLDEKAIAKKGLPSRITSLFAHNFELTGTMEEILSFDGLFKYILKQKRLDQDRDSAWPRKQINFYDHILAMSEGKFAFQFIDTALIIHDFRSDRSRRLRCEWYREHLMWSDDIDQSFPNRDLEDMSLAYMFGKWRMDKRLFPDLEQRMGDRIIDPSRGDSFNEDLHYSGQGNYLPTTKNSLPTEYYLRTHDALKARIKY